MPIHSGTTSFSAHGASYSAPSPSRRTPAQRGAAARPAGMSRVSAVQAGTRPELERFVAAGIANVSAACQFQFWPKVPDPRQFLPLLPASGMFVDAVAGLQRVMGLPATGKVDTVTWAAFRRHAALGQGFGVWVKGLVSITADANSLPVRLCGGSKARRGLWTATEAELQQARRELAAHPGAVLDPNLRGKVVVLATMQRADGRGTQNVGLTYDQILQAALWNTYVAALSPAARSVYGSPANAQRGLRIQRNAPRPLRSVSDPELVLRIARWELTKGWTPQGRLTAEIGSALQREIAAHTEVGRSFSELISFAEPTRRSPSTSREQKTVQAGIRSAGVVSNLNPRLTAAQAEQTEEQRRGAQVRRDQYAREGSLTASSKGLLDLRSKDLTRGFSEEARQRSAATGGRGGFTTTWMRNPALRPGGPLVVGPGTARTRSQQPVDDAEPEMIVPQVDPAAPPPAPAAPPSSDGGPTPWSAENQAWSEASSEEVEQARKGEDEDSWAFDPSNPDAVRPPAEGEEPPMAAEGEAVLEGALAPAKKKGAVLLVLAAVAVGGYFLFRKK